MRDQAFNSKLQGIEYQIKFSTNFIHFKEEA